MAHANAALTPRARLKLARLIVEDRWPIAQAAERFQVSWPTAKRWADRYRELGEAGMADRSARPHSMPRPHPARRWCARSCICAGSSASGRWRSPPGWGWRPPRCIAVLGRCGISRLNQIDRATGEPVRRYEHPYPGSMIHVDVKKLGNIPDQGGWRYVGRGQGKRNRAATPGKPRNAPPQPEHGHRLSSTPCSTTTPGSPTPRSTTTRPPPPPSACCAVRSPGSPPAAWSSSGFSPTTAPPTAPTPGARPAPSSGSPRSGPGPTARRPTGRSNASTAP